MLTFGSYCAGQALQCAIPCTPYNNLSIDSFITTLQIRKLKFPCFFSIFLVLRTRRTVKF